MRRPGVWVLSLFVAATAATAVAQDEVPCVVEVDSVRELERVIDHYRRADLGSCNVLLIRLAPGDYHLTPSAAVDSSCGNCEDPDQRIPITVGLEISGPSVTIEGPVDDEAVIHTHAGYGIFFRNCGYGKLSNLTITGGERDTAQAATDAAVVAQNAQVEIVDCIIRDNIGDARLIEKNIVGIMGVCGRENSRLYIRNNDITRNSWDGIALYRDAFAVIERNYIDGVDKAGGREAGGGRGVGIGVTWNARATIEKNAVRRYWKGIGIFVDAVAEVRANFVEEMRAWGIAYWDAGKGRPRALITENVIYDCGACGISVSREAPFAPDEEPSRISKNIVVNTAHNPKYDAPDYYCYQCAMALHAVPEGMIIRKNVFHDNRTVDEDRFNKDTTRDIFWRKRRHLQRKYRNTKIGVRGSHTFHDTSYLKRYGRM